MRRLLSCSFVLLLSITLCAACGDSDDDASNGSSSSNNGDDGTPGSDDGTPGSDDGTPGSDDGTSGSDDGTSGSDDSAFSTGLDASLQANELTSEQAYQLCLSAAELMEEVEALGGEMDPCIAMGLTAKFQGGGDTASCEAAVEECNAMAESTEQEPSDNEGQSLADDCDPEVDTSELADCDATVGEMESCFTALRAQMQAALDMLSCDMTAEQAQSMDMEDGQNMPPECAFMDNPACNISGDDGHGDDDL